MGAGAGAAAVVGEVKNYACQTLEEETGTVEAWDSPASELDTLKSPALSCKTAEVAACRGKVGDIGPWRILA